MGTKTVKNAKEDIATKQAIVRERNAIKSGIIKLLSDYSKEEDCDIDTSLGYLEDMYNALETIIDKWDTVITKQLN